MRTQRRLVRKVEPHPTVLFVFDRDDLGIAEDVQSEFIEVSHVAAEKERGRAQALRKSYRRPTSRREP